MKTRITLCALSLSLLAVACDDKGRGNSAILAIPTPTPVAVTPVLPAVPVVQPKPVIIVKGGKGGNPKPAPLPDAPLPETTPSVRDPDRDNSRRESRPERPRTPSPGPDISGSDPRDAGRRLDDSTCEGVRALTGGWTIKLDSRWSTAEKLEESDQWIKQKLEERAPGFFSDALCEGLRAVRTKNAAVAKHLLTRIGDKKLEILLTDNDEGGRFYKHRFHIFWNIGVGKPQIKVGRRVVEGVIAAVLPNHALLLAPADSQLKREPQVNHGDILTSQIQAAKATFFHYIIHMAGAQYAESRHSGTSFLNHQKELDVIHACTAQAFPYFYIDAESENGPFYKNSRLACHVCATAAIASPSGAIYPTITMADQEVSQEARLLCESIKDRDPEMIVSPDRAANLYEEMQ